MQNETKLSKEKINSILNMLKNSDQNPEAIKNMLSGSLNQAQKSSLSAILSDPKKISELLSSPQAKELMEKFGKKQQGDKNNGST